MNWRIYGDAPQLVLPPGEFEVKPNSSGVLWVQDRDGECYGYRAWVADLNIPIASFSTQIPIDPDIRPTAFVYVADT